MGVRELPSGRYQARVTIDGRRYAETFDTADDAEDWLLVTRARHVTGTLPSRQTVDQYAARWIAGYDTAPESTRKFHADNLRLYIRPALGLRAFASVTPSDVGRLMNGITRDVSAAKADSVYRTLSALCSSAAEDDVIVRSPCRAKKHRPKRQADVHTVLERTVARQVLLNMRGWQRDTAVLQLALGARFGEVAGLTPHDVTGGKVHIVRRVWMSKTVRATKNHRRRTLDLPRSAVPTVDRLVGQWTYPPPAIPPLQDREWPAEPWVGRWLVQTSTGRPPNLAYFNRSLRKACEAVGAPVVSSHGLRHTYVSWMIDDGHSADKIAFWIGDTPETVRRVYAHMLEGSSAPAATSVDAALGDIG